MSALTARDLDDFLTTLIGEVAEAGFGDLVDQGTSRHADGAPGRPQDDTLSRRVLRVLTSAARECADGTRLVLVIDDADHLQDLAFIHGLIQTVARHDTLHLIVCSRGRHVLEAAATGSVQTVVIAANELRFTVSQVSALAHAMKVPLSGAQAEELHKACDGWPAFVALVLGDIPSPATALPLARAETYVLDALLPTRVEDQATFDQIMLVALSERVSHRLIRDLLEDEDPDSVIALIESLGVAERRYDSQDVLLLFPPFVQATLRSVITQRHPDRTREMHRRLSRWFARRLDAESSLYALRHAVLGRDWAQADGIWMQHSIELEWTSVHQLAAVLDAVPQSVIATRPSMSIARVMATEATLVPADDGGVAARRRYGSASRRRAAKGLAGLRLHDLLAVGAGTMSALRSEGDLSEANRVAEVVEVSARALMARGEDPGDRLSAFHLERGINHTLCADHAAAADRYQLSWHYARPPTSLIAAHAAANLALTYALVGDTGPARLWLDRQQFLESFRTVGAWGGSRITTGARIASALLALDDLDARACRHELDHLGSGATGDDLWPFIAFVNALFGLHYGDPVTSLLSLDNVQRAHHHELAPRSAAIQYLSRARAELLIAAGQGHQVQRWFSGPTFERMTQLAIPLAHLNLLAGKPLVARRIAAQHRWSQLTSGRDRLELLLVKALAAHQMDEPHVSGELTRQALALSRHTGILRPFTTISPADLDALLANAGETLDHHSLAKIRAHKQPYPQHVRIIVLTPREQLLAECLRTTASRSEIADQLYVSVNTLRKQLATLYRKLNVSTRQEALTRLEQLGLAGPISELSDENLAARPPGAARIRRPTP